MMTKNDIILFLKGYGIINQRKYQGEWVLPRPLQGSYYLEEKHQAKEKPETSQAKSRIKIINDRVKRVYEVTDDLLVIAYFGKTYKLTISDEVLAQMNEYRKNKESNEDKV